jgi:hypothetical protein
MKNSRIGKAAMAVLLLAAGAIVGAAMSATREANAEIRATPQPQAFQTGGQLSVPILKEIAATLHQMDSRLARLETLAQKMQAKKEPVSK